MQTPADLCPATQKSEYAYILAEMLFELKCKEQTPAQDNAFKVSKYVGQ